MENELNGGGQGAVAGGGASDAGRPPELAWRREFDTVPSNGKAVFGGLQVNSPALTEKRVWRALCKE